MECWCALAFTTVICRGSSLIAQRLGWAPQGTEKTS